MGKIISTTRGNANKEVSAKKNDITIKFAIIVFIVLQGMSVISQNSDTLALNREAEFRRDSLKISEPRFIRPEIRLDSRTSSFHNTKVNIYGYYAGILIKSKLSIGFGYYRINTIIPAKEILNGQEVNTNLVVNCGGINSELIYYNKRFISLGFPLEFAVGEYNLTYELAETNQLISREVRFLAFTNFGLSGTFKPFKFIGLKLMIGYRKSIYPEERVFSFNSVYSSLGLYADISSIKANERMYRLLKKHNKVSKPLSTWVDLLTD